MDGEEVVPLAHEELDGVHVDRVGRAARGDDLRPRGPSGHVVAATWTSGRVVARERRAGEARARRCLVVVVLVYLAVDAAMMECAVHERVHEIVHDVEGGDRRERVQR